MQPLVIDVEASGFGVGSYPIEVGVAMSDGKVRCMIIRPEPEWQHWDEKAQALHGIGREVLLEHGSPVRVVAEQLNEWLSGETVYSDAWGNDSSWLALLFDAAGIPQRFKLESLRALLSEQQVSRWHETKEKVAGEIDSPRHRASHDARIIQQTYQKTAELARLAGKR